MIELPELCQEEDYFGSLNCYCFEDDGQGLSLCPKLD